MAAKPRRTAEAGSIAILALWGLAIVAILLAVAIRTTRTELRETQNAAALSRARLAAEGGTQLGLTRLLRQRAQGKRSFDGFSEPWQDGAMPVAIAIIDEAGKIDLNQAPLEMLTGLMRAVGQPPEQAQLLACNTLDWRGEVGTACPEPADGFLRRPHLFTVPEELAQVPGFDDEIYAAVSDYVTVATKATAIDPLAAARPVLLAIPGATPALVDSYLAEKSRWHDLAGSDTAMEFLRNVPGVMISPARDFTIRAVAGARGGIRYRADLQVRLTEIPSHPYEFVAMRAPPPERGPVAALAPPRRVP